MAFPVPSLYELFEYDLMNGGDNTREGMYPSCAMHVAYFCFALFELRLYVSVINFSVMSGRIPGLKQY